MFLERDSWTALVLLSNTLFCPWTAQNTTLCRRWRPSTFLQFSNPAHLQTCPDQTWTVSWPSQLVSPVSFCSQSPWNVFPQADALMARHPFRPMTKMIFLRFCFFFAATFETGCKQLLDGLNWKIYEGNDLVDGNANKADRVEDCCFKCHRDASKCHTTSSRPFNGWLTMTRD